MRDEYDGRIWVDNHEQFTAFVTQVIDGIRVTFRKIHDIEFDAPWRKPERRP